MQEKETGTNDILLCQSRNITGQFKKSYLNRPINILHFSTPTRSQKRFTKLQNILAFLAIYLLQAELRI